MAATAVVLAAGALSGCAGHLLPTSAPDRSVHTGITRPTGPDDLLEPNGAHDVVLAGDSWDGTATIFDPHNFEVITWIDIVPDHRRWPDAVNADRGRRRLKWRIRHSAGEQELCWHPGEVGVDA